MNCRLASAIILVLAGVASAQDTPRFSGTVRQAGGVGYATNFSGEKDAATLLFDSFGVELNENDFDSVASETFGVIVPVESAVEGARYTIDIRGYVDTTPEADVCLIVITDGRTHVLDKSRGLTKSDFGERVAGTLSGSAKQINLVVVAVIGSRTSTKPGTNGPKPRKIRNAGNGLLTIDSIDIAFVDEETADTNTDGQPDDDGEQGHSDQA